MSSAVAAPPPPPQIGNNERLGATAVLSLILHGVLVLGVGFALDDAAPVLPTLDVILTQVQTPLTPAQADFLAQANNQGGGEHDKASRPGEAQIGIADRPTPGVATQPLRRQSPVAQPPPEARVITAMRSDARTVQPLDTPPPVDAPYPEGRAKVERDMEMARRAAEIQLRSEAYAKRPKRKFVSASTKEYAYAGYMRQWVDRVQRVGNLNYPDEARRRRIGGVVVISVAVRRDGSVEKTVIVESSHTPMLDEAALRIVKLSEPFAPLPKTPEDVDILHVTRTWQFMPGGELIDR
ncbi:energy transducer TonB [Lysobacter sp. A6]|uniref:Energy transducer TonB n=1 Tax=Noviluteimonas lactosilytica TaxID=2888523 RepID=A0ABS8JFR3_9GAMM|nr:energy transducer TonB [Lysobacter lactosilyticus]MCC8362394.1 energy transducer TonB [Lysobacter lactosilyticus]